MQPGPPLVEPRAGRPRPGPRALATLAAAASLLLALGLALAWQPSPPAPGPAQGATSGVSGVSPGSAAPTLSPYDVDGVPRLIGSEPVLRGSAIVERAREGGSESFIVAGWHTQDPMPSCAPSKYHCGFTSLTDGPGDRQGGRITLDRPAGTQFSFDATAQWVGGFYVLRVRPACSYFSGLCLVVDEEIRPPGILPAGPSGFDSDGLPRTVDGQAVVRGIEVATRLPTTPYAGPLYVAGQVETVAPSAFSRCPDPVTWGAHACPAVRLADPAQGRPFDATAPELLVARWGVQEAWDGTALWPGGYVVLRADSRFVFGFVPAPGSSPQATQAPMPSMIVSSWAQNGRVVEIEGRRVSWGVAISALLARGSTASFLVTGVARDLPCGDCDGGTIPVLREPPVRGVKDGGTEYPLLRADGSAFVVGKAMLWTEPKGAVVLEVRRYVGRCPAGIDCANSLEVVSVAAPPP